MKNVALPYIDNAKAVLLTVAVNLGVVFLFNWPGGVAFGGVLQDSLVCAVITTAIDMGIVYAGLKKMRAAGSLPAQVPVSRFMQKLPQNPFALGVIYAAAFGALTVGINAAILRFFGMTRMAFAPWLVYKLIYATVLSVKITEYIIFRYVQPDWAHEKNAAAEAKRDAPETTIKNPLPKIGVFKAMFDSVVMNTAMNIIIGSLLGGAGVGPNGSVIINPTTAEGIPITGLVFGLIVGVLVTNGVVTAMNAVIAATPAMLQMTETDRRVAWMPRRRAALTCVVCLCVMAFSSVALRAIMVLFGISLMNFYQFTVFITIYATLIGKPISAVLTRRCMQPDYIRYTLRRKRG